MDRRSFFGFLPMAPVVVGAAIAEESNKDHRPSNGPVLTLQQYDFNTERVRVKSNSFMISGYETTGKKVDLSVGKDGKLWIKTNDEDWKRVVTE